MKVSYNWLKDYLDLSDYSHEQLNDILSFKVCELEGYDPLVQATGLVCGYVLECEDIPDTHLHKLQMDLGARKTQIVCGAPNIAAGQKVIVAVPGAVLPGDFVIKETKLRGIESNGMVCSLQELGIDASYVEEEYKDGIYVLPEDAPVGSDAIAYLGFDDYVINLELTANRSDLLSVEGIAYDLGAAIAQKPKVETPKVEEIEKENPVSVEVQTPLCKKYLTRYISNVKITRSPNYIRERLIAGGIRPINNVVDVTNYILLKLGQPLHSFDADKLGNKIVVRNALKGEKLVTLDGEERSLEETDVVITAGNEALCLGGVMGGLSTEVSEETQNIILEAAYFDPLTIRKTSARLSLQSESSMRFERKICFSRVERALDEAASLIASLGNGEVLKGVNGVGDKQEEPKVVTLTLQKTNSVLGTNLNKDELETIFTNLGYEYSLENSTYSITLPDRRMDLLESYQDVIEDVARMYGYNNIPTILPNTNDKGGLTQSQSIVRQTRKYLSSIGGLECISYSLVDAASLKDFVVEDGEPIKVLMPLTEDRSIMRQSLVGSLLQTVKYNCARGESDLFLFEYGKTYTTTAETNRLSIVMNGHYINQEWQNKAIDVDFFVLKGVLDGLFSKLGVTAKYESAPELLSTMHSGRVAKITVSDKYIGYIGELHPRYQLEHDMPEAYVCEINFDLLLSLLDYSISYTQVSKYPSVTRDLALLVNKDVTSSQLIDVINMVCKKNLVSAKVFDVFEVPLKLGDEKSVGIKIVLQNKEKTLESADVDKIIKSVLNRLDYFYKAHLR